MKERKGLFCIWSDGDADECGSVSLAMTDTLGLPFGELAGIAKQVEMAPEELGIKKGDNWISCGGFDERVVFWWLEKVSNSKAYQWSREILLAETQRYLSGAPFVGYEADIESIPDALARIRGRYFPPPRDVF